MSWYLILLIIVGYLFIGAVVIGFIARIFQTNKHEDAVPALLFTIPIWPLVGLGALLILVVIYVADWKENHENRKDKYVDTNLRDL